MLLKIQWGKEEITKGGIFKIRKLNFIKKKKRKGKGNLLVIKDYFSTIQKAGAGLLLQVTITFIEVTMHRSAMQLFIVLLCIFDVWNVIFFTVCPAKPAQKAYGVSGCRKAELPRCLPGLRCAERAMPAGLCLALPVLHQVHLGSALHCTGQIGSSGIPPFL